MREVGVRRALGATTRDVLRLVVGNATRMIAIGAVIGLTFSIAFSQWMAAMLFGVQPLDVPTIAGVAIVILVTAVISIAGPAWRITRIDPLVVLRSE